MEIVDMQLHEPAPFEDWAAADTDTRRRVMTEALWQSMDAVGVNAVVVNPLEDPTWAADLAGQFPDRVATALLYNPDGREIADVEAHVAGLYGQPGAVAIRFSALQTAVSVSGDASPMVSDENLSPDSLDRLVTGQFDDAFAACERQGVPIWFEIQGGAHAIDRIAGKFPGLQIFLDHMGMNQPPAQIRDVPPWKDLPVVLKLSRHENVAIKVCAPMSFTDEPYPFAEAWPPVAQLLEAFGPARLAWASDIGYKRGRSGYQVRLVSAATADAPAEYRWSPDAHVPGPPPGAPDYPGKHTYMESLAFFLYNDRLSASEKEQILGQTARRLLKWPAPSAASTG